MAHNSMMTMNSNNSDVVVLLCAPSHDRLTHYTSSLLEDFPSLGTRTILCTFDSPLKYDQLLANYSINPKETDVAVIFCGHGKDPSLQGPGENPGSPDYSTAQSVFYEDSFLHMGPKIMLAACCYSALG